MSYNHSSTLGDALYISKEDLCEMKLYGIDSWRIYLPQSKSLATGDILFTLQSTTNLLVKEPKTNVLLPIINIFVLLEDDTLWSYFPKGVDTSMRHYIQSHKR